MNKKITLILLGLFAAAWNATPAHAISILSIDNTDFTVTPASEGLNNARADEAANTTSNPTGFGDVFDHTIDPDNTYLLLGSDDANSAINAGTNASLSSSNVTATSTSFTITSDNIANGLLNVAFDWSFQGNTPNDRDGFFVDLTGPSFATVLERDSLSYGDGSASENIDISGFTAGTYNLLVSLDESVTFGNSAAGFDNIVIKEVPFGAAPNTGLLILGGMYAVSSYRKRRKISK